MASYQSPDVTGERLRDDFLRIRHTSEQSCEPLAVDDYQLQSMAAASPPKWHLGHVTWFFETFLLQPFAAGYSVFHPRFDYLFNSYYYRVGSVQPRAERGLLSSPTVEQVYEYRAHVDRPMVALTEGCKQSDWPQIRQRISLGLNHEQQHQELFYMDLKHHFSMNPLLPAYRDDLPLPETAESPPGRWIEGEEGIVEIRASRGQSPLQTKMVPIKAAADGTLPDADHIDDIKLAPSKRLRIERRAFQAEMTLKYCAEKARRAEDSLSPPRLRPLQE